MKFKGIKDRLKEHKRERYVLRLGDSLEILKTITPESVDAVVCDPPYGLSFMNQKWDYDVPGVELWQQVFKVLKPGGYLLAFCGTRTYHRLVVNIEDAGFEVRDMMQWIYGQGFPKSLDISKAIDKEAGAEREVVGSKKAGLGTGGVKGERFSRSITSTEVDITAPATSEAKKWNGWGTALKPANEPICVAQKPILEKTIAKNVLQHGVGGLNIDGCRIGNETRYNNPSGNKPGGNSYNMSVKGMPEDAEGSTVTGRFPSNVLLDEQAAEVLDEQSGDIKSSKGSGLTPTKARSNFNASIAGINRIGYEDSGGASRFFYVAKASTGEKQEDGDNGHPTVKPIQLMRYLVRLVTPPNGIVLDPFMGSGSTGIAALKEGFQFLGVERDLKFFTIAERRVSGVFKAKS